jgi:glycosyltransferase involved in cell wall biosynthesis
MIRVLISGHLPPPMGGIGTYYRTLLNSSLPTQVDLKFVETSSNKRPLSKSGSWSLNNVFSALGDCFRFANAVLEHQPEISHIATAYGLSFVKHSICILIARLMGSKVLLHPHCSFSILYSQKPKSWQWFFRKIIGLTDGVVALSSEWHQLNNIVSSCRVYNLPNGINLIPYCEIGSERKNLRNCQVPLHILYLGYIGKAKGSFDLVLAAEKLHDDPIQFDLMGDDHLGWEINQLKKEISEAGLNSLFNIYPPTDGKEKFELLRTADLFTYPSYHEGMPIAIIEAMACALPVVATRVGGIPDLVSPGVNGLLVEAGHPDQLAEAIHRLVIDPDTRKSMQVNSFKIAQEEYDVEKLVIKLVEQPKPQSKSREKGTGRHAPVCTRFWA